MSRNAVAMETFTEWTAACEVQRRFMQHSGPTVDTIDYSAECRQVQELGGDFYDFVPLPDNFLALAVGDASGKGLAAALRTDVDHLLPPFFTLLAHDCPVMPARKPANPEL